MTEYQKSVWKFARMLVLRRWAAKRAEAVRIAGELADEFRDEDLRRMDDYVEKQIKRRLVQD